MPVFRLQFPLELVPAYAARYTDDDADVLAIGREVGDRGHYTLDEFRRVCRWKTPRSAPLVAQNSNDAVEASTRLALADAVSDRERVKELQSLRGVGLPTASVLLHLSTPIAFPSSTSGLSMRSECRRHRTATGSGSPTSPSIGGWSVRPGSTDARSTRLSGSGRGGSLQSDHLCSSARTLSRAGVLAQPCGFDRRDVPFLLLHDEAQLAAECPATAPQAWTRPRS